MCALGPLASFGRKMLPNLDRGSFQREHPSKRPWKADEPRQTIGPVLIGRGGADGVLTLGAAASMILWLVVISGEALI